jgi:hypothetical protein
MKKIIFIIFIIEFFSINIYGQQKYSILEKDKLAIYLVQSFRTNDNTGDIQIMPPTPTTNDYYKEQTYNLLLSGMGLEYSLNNAFSLDVSLKTLPSNISVGKKFVATHGWLNSEMQSLTEWEISAKYRRLIMQHMLLDIGCGIDYGKTIFAPEPFYSEKLEGSYSSFFGKIGTKWLFNDRKATFGINLKYNNINKIEYDVYQMYKTNILINPLSFETVFSYYFE